MAQQTIGIGSTANDGTGDPLRTAFGKANDNFNELYAGTFPAFSGALVKKSADQTGANYSAGVAIAWDAESYDEGGWHDNATNNTRLTVPSGVSYIRIYISLFAQNVAANSQMWVNLRKNGIYEFDGFSTNGLEWSVTDYRFSVASAPLAVIAGDYFEAVLTAGDTSIDIPAAYNSFAIEKVA